MKPEDWEAVSKIYKLGVETGIATFETEIPSWSIWDKSHLKKCNYRNMLLLT